MILRRGSRAASTSAAPSTLPARANGRRPYGPRTSSSPPAPASITSVCPVRFSGHGAIDAPFTVDEPFMARVEWCLDQAEANGLALVLAMSDYDDLQRSPPESAVRFAGLWRQVATRLAERPRSVVFDLLNQPNDTIAATWNGLSTAVSAIRESNPDRVVIVSGADWSAATALDALALPDDVTAGNWSPELHLALFGQ